MDDDQNVYLVRTDSHYFLNTEYPTKIMFCAAKPPQHSCAFSTRIQCQNQILFSDEDSNTFPKVAENRQFPFQAKLLKKDGRQL